MADAADAAGLATGAGAGAAGLAAGLLLAMRGGGLDRFAGWS